VLVFQRSLKMTPNLIPPPSTWLHHAWTLVHVGEYAQAMHTLAPSTLVTPLAETIATFHHLHPMAKVDPPSPPLPFVEDFLIETNLVLDKETFIFALAHSPCLSSDDPLSMVYELLWDFFFFNDFTSGPWFLFWNMWVDLSWSFSSIKVELVGPRCRSFLRIMFFQVWNMTSMFWIRPIIWW